MTNCRSTISRVRLGAATPVQRFLDDAALARALPAMPRCAVWFADDQIRAQATVGGNIVNASPAADVTPCLIAHDAKVELASARGERTMPLADFVTGPNQDLRSQEGELLVAIECDALPGYGGSFEKVGHRRSLVISLVCLAALIKLDARGRNVEDVRLAIAGIGPKPLRLTEVETFLRGGSLELARLEQAADMPVSLVASRTRQDYRRDVVRGFMLRGLINAARRAGADLDSAHARAGGGLCLISASKPPSTAAKSRAAPSRISACSIFCATISISPATKKAAAPANAAPARCSSMAC